MLDSRLHALFAPLLLTVGTADAQHSFGTFDFLRSVELTGTVEGVDFVYPHAWLRLNVPGRG